MIVKSSIGKLLAAEIIRSHLTDQYSYGKKFSETEVGKQFFALKTGVGALKNRRSSPIYLSNRALKFIRSFDTFESLLVRIRQSGQFNGRLFDKYILSVARMNDAYDKWVRYIDKHQASFPGECNIYNNFFVCHEKLTDHSAFSNKTIFPLSLKG